MLRSLRRGRKLTLLALLIIAMAYFAQAIRPWMESAIVRAEVSRFRETVELRTRNEFLKLQIQKLTTSLEEAESELQISRKLVLFPMRGGAIGAQIPLQSTPQFLRTQSGKAAAWIELYQKPEGK